MLDGTGVNKQRLLAAIDTSRKNAATNPLNVITPVSQATYYRLKQELAPVTSSAAIRNSSRIRAGKEIQNAISAAAVASVALAGVSPELLTGTDDVTLLLGDQWNQKPTVFLTQKVKAVLSERNISPSIFLDQTQRRTMTYNITHTAAGRILHTGVKIVDKIFTQLDVFSIDETLSIWHIPPGTEAAMLSERYFKYFVIPQLVKARNSLLENRAKPIAAFVFPQDDRSAAAIEPPTPTAPSEALTLRCAISIDGAHGQIHAMEARGLAAECKDQNIEVVKWAAACSMVQAPPDVGSMHRTLHNYFKNGAFNYEQDPFPSELMADYLRLHFDPCKIAEASKRTYRKALVHTQAALNKAFTISAIQHAWNRGGYVPYDAAKIMSGYALWSEVPGDEAQLVVDTIPALAEIVSTRGRLLDSEIKEALTSAGLSAELFQQREVAFEAGALNQQRSLWLNNTGCRSTSQSAKSARSRQKLKQTI